MSLLLMFEADVRVTCLQKSPFLDIVKRGIDAIGEVIQGAWQEQALAYEVKAPHSCWFSTALSSRCYTVFILNGLSLTRLSTRPPHFCCCPQDAEQQYGDYLVAYNDSVVAIDEALAIGVEVSGDEEEILGEEPAQVEQVQQGEEHKVDEAEELGDADNEKAA